MAFALLQLRTWLSVRLPDRDDDRGASLVEYALLLALIAIVCLVAVNAPRRTDRARASRTAATASARRPIVALA